MNTKPPASSRTSSPRRISRSATTPIMTTRSIRPGSSGTMCCSTTRSSVSSCDRQVLSNRVRHEVHHGSCEPPHQQRHDVSIQRFRRRLDGEYAAAHGAASAQGQHGHRKRRVDRAREHHHAWCEDRRRRDHRRLFRGGEGRSSVHRLRLEPGEIHQGAL